MPCAGGVVQRSAQIVGKFIDGAVPYDKCIRVLDIPSVNPITNHIRTDVVHHFSDDEKTIELIGTCQTRNIFRHRQCTAPRPRMSPFFFLLIS